MFTLFAKTNRYSPRETKLLDYVSQFTSDIRYIAGIENVSADTLSRLLVGAFSSPVLIGLIEMATDQPTLDSLDISSPEFFFLCIFLKEPFFAMFLPGHPESSFMNTTVVLLLKHYIHYLSPALQPQ